MKNERNLTAVIIGAVVVLLILIVVFMRPPSVSNENPPATAISVPTATAVPPSSTDVPPTATAIPPTPTPEESNNAAIQNIVWQWTQLTDQGTVTTVPNPGSYTLTFYPDETFTGKADCNSISGTYSTRNGFSVKVQTSTTAYCGETSLDTLYLSTLEDVVAGGPDGAGGLALETGGGAQRMQFRNGGVAP